MKLNHVGCYLNVPLWPTFDLKVVNQTYASLNKFRCIKFKFHPKQKKLHLKKKLNLEGRY
jgi:hypothetical protein